MKSLKDHLSRHHNNYRGWRTSRKIVVIESDDWGSVRMPSDRTYELILNKGLPVDRSPYLKFDALASQEDLEALFDHLYRFKDSMGNAPIVTANTIVANPDFKKIRDSAFQDYHYELFTEILERYPKHQKSFAMWKEGMEKGVFRPQFHGREHINIPFWFKQLQNGNSGFRLAFDHGFWGLSNDVYPEMKRSVQAAYDIDETDGFEFQSKTVSDGLDLFESIFGFRSQSFIAPNFIWDSRLNRVLFDSGVNYLQGMKYQKLPLYDGKRRGMIRHTMGEKNKWGQVYLIRNCSFEPSLKSANYDNVGNCLKEISNAFFWNKPAIITSHRVNFIGYLNQENRSRNLASLKLLLKKILHQWPDVEFMSSDRLGEIIENNNRASLFENAALNTSVTS